MTEASDVEIYVANLGAAPLKAWLCEQLDGVQALKHTKGIPKNAMPLEGEWKGNRFTIIILERVVDGFTSLWLNSRELPWRDDKDCGQAAARYFNREVRVAAGGWQEQDDPDAWISISPQGEETDIKWKTD